MTNSFFDHFWETGAFMPHGHCYLWMPEILWLNVGSDLIIAISYYIIPFYLLYLVKKRKDLNFNWLVAMFALFIFACGTTHFFDIITVWRPLYAQQGLIKLVTAGLSLATVFLLVPLIPKAIKLPSRSALDDSRKRLQDLNEQLEQANLALEEKVKEKTEDLVLLAATVEHSNDAIIIKDMKGNISFWNKAAELLYGFTAEEVLDKPMQQLIPKDKRDEFASIMQKLYKGEKIETFDTSRLTKEQKNLHVSLSISLIKDSEGEMIGSAHIVRDITTRLLAEENLKKSEDRFRKVIEAAPNGLIMVNYKGIMVLCNAQVEELFGFKKDELIGHPIDMLIPNRFRRNHTTFVSGFMEKPEARQMGAGRDLYGLRKDGSEFSIEIGLSPIHIGNEIYVLSSIVDITKRKIMEDQLRHYSKVMEQKNLEMEQFVYTVSHDLKSPLVTSTGFLGLIREDLESKRYENLPDSFSRLERANHRMSQLIDDLLQISRIGRIKLEFEKVNATELIGTICENLSSQIKEANMTIEIQPGIEIPFADKKRIYQVFENLIINALKYGVGSHIKKVLIGMECKDNEVCIFVKDYGLGIAKEYHKKIFGLFQRLEADNRGTGVGLTIVSRIMQLHEGRVWVDSDIGKGATFWLAFPLTAPHSYGGLYE